MDLELILPAFPTKKLIECTYTDLAGIGTEKIDPCQLVSLCLPNSLPSWPNNVLDGCRNLRQISVYGPVGTASLTLTTSHGLGVLHKLESFEIPATVRTLSSAGCGTADSSRIIPVNVKSVTLPETITTIGGEVFCKCAQLTTVILANRTNLTSIGSYAFEYCSALTSVDISGCTNLTKISHYAFYNCTNLILFDASLCTKLTTIDSNAFYYCNKLACVILPTTLTTIGSSAFQKNSGTIQSLIWRGGSSRPSAANGSGIFASNSTLSTLISNGSIKESFVS